LDCGAFFLYICRDNFFKLKFYSMCYIAEWQLDGTDYGIQPYIDELRFYFGEAEKAKTEYDVLEGQSICELLLSSLERARGLSEGEHEVYQTFSVLQEAENIHLLPLFADLQLKTTSYAVDLLRQLPQFQNWYDPKEGDVATVLHPDSRKSIRRKFYEGSWVDIVSLNTNLA
jgi:hypothetical protein